LIMPGSFRTILSIARVDSAHRFARFRGSFKCHGATEV
jgi:hypothetical protein